jgi:hypothetical protein
VKRARMVRLASKENRAQLVSLEEKVKLVHLAWMVPQGNKAQLVKRVRLVLAELKVKMV